jgi:hypothetical protein
VQVPAPRRPLAGSAPRPGQQVILDLLQELREKVVVGLNASGQVREFQLRSRLRFRLRTPQGASSSPRPSCCSSATSASTKPAVLAKEAEEGAAVPRHAVRPGAAAHAPPGAIKHPVSQRGCAVGAADARTGMRPA